MELLNILTRILNDWEKFHWKIIEKNVRIRMGSHIMSHLEFSINERAGSVVINRFIFDKNYPLSILKESMFGYVYPSREFNTVKVLIEKINKELSNDKIRTHLEENSFLMMKTNNYVNENLGIIL